MAYYRSYRKLTQPDTVRLGNEAWEQSGLRHGDMRSVTVLR